MRSIDDTDWEPGDPPPDRPVHLVLDATGALGGALCALLARHGARLVATGRDVGRLADLAKETGAEALAVDAHRFDEVACAVAFALERFGRLDGVACLAGTAPPSLEPAHHAVRAALPALRALGGSIVLVSSAAARPDLERLACEAAAWHAASAVRVNWLAPDPAQGPSAGLGEPEEVAATIAWLLGPESGSTTGAVLRPDDDLARLRPRARA